MHLAVLMTNTDESAFAQAHPKDGEKFTAMIHTVRPEWRVTSFAVKDGVFPEDLSSFDGAMITGSPASVHDGHDWIARLLEVIRDAYARGQPLFGACFGHQAIALALGGAVNRNQGGWGFGAIGMQQVAPMPWYHGPEAFRQYGAHIEQVSLLPDGAQTVFRSDTCRCGGFVMGNRVYTTQNHPEMTADFAAALVEEYADALGPEVATRARASLTDAPDTAMFAETIARFFEHAARD